MGLPKATLPFGPELMLQRVVRLLQEVVHPIVVVAAPGQEVPALPGDVILTADEREGRGPLQGLHAGLLAIGDRAASGRLIRRAMRHGATAPNAQEGWRVPTAFAHEDRYRANAVEHGICTAGSVPCSP